MVTAREIRLSPDARIAVDVDAFWAAMTVGDHEEAVNLYRGELVQNSTEEWLIPIRERTDRAYLSALSQAVTGRASRSDVDGAVDLAWRLMNADPWREDAVRVVMQLRERSGDRGGALKFYQEFASRLHDEFGASPSMETVELSAQIAARARERGGDQLQLFEHRQSGWVGEFPWWWVARLRGSPTTLAVAAYLRTLEGSRYQAFDLPVDAHERVGLKRRNLEQALREMCDLGILELVASRLSVVSRIRFVFEEPRAMHHLPNLLDSQHERN